MNTENNLWNTVEIQTDDILLDSPEITRTASSWLSNAVEIVKKVAAPVTEPIKKFIAPVVTPIVKPIEKLGDFAAPYVAPVVKTIEKVGDVLAPVIAPIVKPIDQATTWFDKNYIQPSLEELTADFGYIAYPIVAQTIANDNPRWTGLTQEQRNYLRNEFGDLVDKVKIHYDSALLNEITVDNYPALVFPLFAVNSLLIPGQGLPKIKLGNTAGQTFGYDIYISDPSATLELLAHEMQHTRQFVDRGSSLANFGKDYFRQQYRHGYDNNPMEIEAYNLDARIAQDLQNNDLNVNTGLPNNSWYNAWDNDSWGGSTNGSTNNDSENTNNSKTWTINAIKLPPAPATDTLTGNKTGENVMRFWDKQTGGHFYTTKQSEIQDRLTNPTRYQSEGNEFDAPLAGTPGTLPVYRYLNKNTQTYFYTIQAPGDIIAQFPVFTNDGIAFYAYKDSQSAPTGSVPIHRFYNNDASAKSSSPVHFFTGTDSNKQTVMNTLPSFKYEGAGFYDFPKDYVV